MDFQFRQSANILEFLANAGFCRNSSRNTFPFVETSMGADFLGINSLIMIYYVMPMSSRHKCGHQSRQTITRGANLTSEL